MGIKYKNLVIYYFSGTGNARNCSAWIAREASARGLTTHLINIDRFERVILPKLDEGRTLIGFAYPTHGFNAAPIMLRFLSRFPRLDNCDTFLLNTRAGMKLSRAFLPGISGLAQFIPALMLLMKGYRIIAMKPVDLPSNWISLHPGLKQKVVDSIYGRWYKKIKSFSVKLLAGKRNYRALFDLPVDIWLFPIAIGYYVIGRYALAKTFIVTDSCNGCKLCVRQCPTKSIMMRGRYPYWKLSCESCMRCMNNCPERAIETAHTVSGFVWYIAWGIVTPVILTFFISSGIMIFEPGSILARLFYWVILGVVTILLVSLAYYLMHFLLRFRFFNKFIAYTSFTHFRFWRRYKAPDVG